MALRIDCASVSAIRHLFARSRGRRCLFPDARSRALAARQLADVCERHDLRCIAWCITDRCMHVVARGRAAALTLATEELAGARLAEGHALSTPVKPDLYLLEVARHALLAPVRGGHCRRAIDWPYSSAQAACGVRPVPAWLDPDPLYDLLGPRDDRCHERFRRFMDGR
jgi:putative transposase